jgi:hypothetical protein
MQGMFVRDLHTAVTMTQRFRWPDMCMWPGQLPEHSLVVPGGRDYLLCAPALAAMLRAAGCGDSTILHPGLDHGAGGAGGRARAGRLGRRQMAREGAR